MLQDNIRLCVVCEGVIPKGEKYRVSTVPKAKRTFSVLILFGDN